jgi:hypothetical protein
VADEITVTVSEGGRDTQGKIVWAVACDQCGLVGTRMDRDAAERVSDDHLTRHGVA